MDASGASRTVSLRDPRSILWFLYYRPSIRLGIALVIPVVIRVLIPLISSVWLLGAWLGLLLLVTALLAWRRRSLAWVTAYLLLSDIWVLLWIEAGDPALPLHVDYPVVLDRILGLGDLPTERLQHWFHHDGAIGPHDVVLVAVYVSFFFAHQATLFAVWLLRPRLLGRYAVAFLVMSYVSLGVFFLAPTAPPWMATELGAAPEMLRVTHEVFRAAAGSAFDQGYSAAAVNEVAAMPSVHLGATYVLAVAWVRARPGLRWPAVAYCLAMGLALVYLGEHYLVDVLAGATLGFVAWRVSDFAFARIPWLAGNVDEPATDAAALEEPARAA